MPSLNGLLVLAALLALAAAPAQAAEQPPQPVGLHYCSATAWPHDNGKLNTIVGGTVTKEGAFDAVALVQSSGDAHLDAMALDCARAWKYRPALRDGAAVDYSWQATVLWGGHPATADCARAVEVDKSMLDGIGGVTRIAFKIMPNGSVQDTEVRQSSGNDALDKAALDCVTAFRYDVTHISYPPGGYPQDATIDWHDSLSSAAAPVPQQQASAAPTGSLSLIAPKVAERHSCRSSSRVVNGDVPAGPTVIKFTVGTDGAVHDAAIQASSGNDQLDDSALKCVVTWRYNPATDNGAPVAMAWQAVVSWRPR